MSDFTVTAKERARRALGNELPRLPDSEIFDLMLALDPLTQFGKSLSGYAVHAVRFKGRPWCNAMAYMEPRPIDREHLRQLLQHRNSSHLCGRCREVTLKMHAGISIPTTLGPVATILPVNRYSPTAKTRLAPTGTTFQAPPVSRQKSRDDVTPSVRARIMERDGFRCRRCGHGREDQVKLVVDHIVPVARGGTSDDSNLQTLCRDCNAGKAARDPHPHDFIQ